MDVRPFTPADRDACLAIFDSNEGFGSEDRASFLHFLDSTPGPYFVMDHDGEVVGCGGWERGPEPDQATLRWGMIRRDLRGKGLGKFLLLYRIRNISKEAGVPVIRLTTEAGTAGFYEKFAFRVFGPARPDGWVELRMKAQVCA